MKEYRLKVEIAQLSLSDLGREDHAYRKTLGYLATSPTK
jgi:hypothetical protein